MTQEKMNLETLTHKLDNVKGGLGLNIDVMDDIATNFMQLVDDMNNLSESKDLKIYFREWHRELRILSQLMYYTMESAMNDKNELHELSENIFDIVRDK